MEPKESIFDALLKLGIAKGANPSKERLQIYVEILSRFKQNNVLNCISYFLLREKFFPDISEIINYLDPKPSNKEIAVSSVGLIIEAIKKFGVYQEQSAKESLEKLWPAILSFGGWRSVCSSEIDSNFKAQMRDCVISQFSFSPQSKKDIYSLCFKFSNGQLELKQSESFLIENKSDPLGEKEISEFLKDFTKQGEN